MNWRDNQNVEPTLRDVIEIMDTRFLIIDQRLVALTTLNERMDGIDSRLGTINRKLSKVEMTLLDMQDDLTSALAAVDRDSVTLIDHEKRLKSLEARK